MKKLLLVAALLLTVSTAAVACTTQDTNEGTETTAGGTTAAETTAAEDPADTTAGEETTIPEETTLPEETTKSEETTVEETTVEETTPAPETLPEQPEAGVAVQVKPSWDSIYKNEENNLAQADAGAAEKFTAAPFKLDDTWHTIMFRGWAGSGDTENKIVKFGYRIDLGELVVDDAAFRDAEDGVIAAGGDARYCISVPTEPLKGGMHYIRCYGIAADGTAVEILNIWIQGRDLTAIEAAQAWDADNSVVTHLSFDELRDGGSGIFAPGAAAGWDGIAKVNDSITTLQFWGWVGIVADTVGTFGYSIDGNAPIFDAAWNVEAEQGVIDAAKGTGAASASRMLINIPVAGLVGEHTVKVYYKAADDSAACILKEFTVAGPAVLDTADAGVHNNHVQKDSEVADDYSASIAGWLGFDEYTPDTLTLGWSVDGGAITWDGSINSNCEAAIKEPGNGGPNGFRFSIKASLTGLPYGDHEINYYAKLPTGDLCLLNTQYATTKDPSAVGNSTYDYDTATDPDLAAIFTFSQGLDPAACSYNAPNADGVYKMAGINQLIAKAEGTYQMTVKGLKTDNGHAAIVLRGNPNPNFGDPNYYGHDGNNDQSNPDSLSVGCAGIYVGIEGTTLRINVKGEVDGVAIPHVFKVEMTSNDLTIIDDNNTITFKEGDKVLATVALTGMEQGYATQAVVTANGETTTLDDVCAAATVASDFGFIGRSSALTFTGLTLKALAE